MAKYIHVLILIFLFLPSVGFADLTPPTGGSINGDDTYLRLDGTNDPVQGEVQFNEDIHGEAVGYTITSLVIDGAPGAYDENNYDFDVGGFGCANGTVVAMTEDFSTALGICGEGPSVDIHAMYSGTESVRACLLDATAVMGPGAYITALMPASDTCANLVTSINLIIGPGATISVDDPNFLKWNSETLTYDHRDRLNTYTIVSTWDDPVTVTTDFQPIYAWHVENTGDIQAEDACVTSLAVNTNKPDAYTVYAEQAWTNPVIDDDGNAKAVLGFQGNATCSTSDCFGVGVFGQINLYGSGDYSGAYGVSAIAGYSGSGTASYINGGWFAVGHYGTGTMASANAMYAELFVMGDGDMTDGTVAMIESPTIDADKTGVITNNRGIWIEDQSCDKKACDTDRVGTGYGIYIEPFSDQADYGITSGTRINLWDDVPLTFGNDEDASIYYDESGNDELVIDATTIALSGVAKINADSTENTWAMSTTKGTSGQVLTLNAESTAVWEDASGGATELSELTDITLNGNYANYMTLIGNNTTAFEDGYLDRLYDSTGTVYVTTTNDNTTATISSSSENLRIVANGGVIRLGSQNEYNDTKFLTISEQWSDDYDALQVMSWVTQWDCEDADPTDTFEQLYTLHDYESNAPINGVQGFRLRTRNMAVDPSEINVSNLLAVKIGTFMHYGSKTDNAYGLYVENTLANTGDPEVNIMTSITGDNTLLAGTLKEYAYGLILTGIEVGAEATPTIANDAQIYGAQIFPTSISSATGTELTVGTNVDVTGLAIFNPGENNLSGSWDTITLLSLADPEGLGSGTARAFYCGGPAAYRNTIQQDRYLTNSKVSGDTAYLLRVYTDTITEDRSGAHYALNIEYSDNNSAETYGGGLNAGVNIKIDTSNIGVDTSNYTWGSSTGLAITMLSNNNLTSVSGYIGELTAFKIGQVQMGDMGYGTVKVINIGKQYWDKATMNIGYPYYLFTADELQVKGTGRITYGWTGIHFKTPNLQATYGGGNPGALIGMHIEDPTDANTTYNWPSYTGIQIDADADQMSGNKYGIYIGAMTNGDTNYGLYSEGDGYFGGDLTVGGDLWVNGGWYTDPYTDNIYNTLVGNSVAGAGNLVNEGSESSGLVAIGYKAMYSVTSSSSSVAVGVQALAGNTSGDNNTAVGNLALGNTGCIPDQTVAIGEAALSGLVAQSAKNVSIGSKSGKYLNNKSTTLTDIEDSVLIGFRTSILANGDENVIVVGYDAQGRGDDTTTIGNTDTVNWLMHGGMIGDTESVTCGDGTNVCAYSAEVLTSYYTTDDAGDGADVVTVSDGEAGQTRRFVLKTNEGDNLSIAPSNFANGTSITLEAAGESITLEFDGTNWFIVSGYGYTVVP